MVTMAGIHISETCSQNQNLKSAIIIAMVANTVANCVRNASAQKRRNVMKRRLIALIMTTALITASLAGCGKNKPGDEGTGTEIENAGEDQSQDGAAEGDNAEEAQLDTPITIVDHPLSCVASGKEVSNGTYPEIILSEEFRTQYPAVVQSIEEMNASWKDITEFAVNEYGYYQVESEEPIAVPYASEITIDVVRADDALFSILISYFDDAGGVHPSHSKGAVNIDVQTGNILELKEALKDDENAPQQIMDKLYATYPDQAEGLDSYAYLEEGQTILDTYAEKLDANLYTWTITTEGLHIYFSPYEVAPYAAGYLDAVLPFDEYPDLVEPKYIPEKEMDKDAMIGRTSADMQTMEPTEPVYNDFELPDDDDNTAIVVPNKSWKPFTEDGRGPDDGVHITLTKTSEDKKDWINTDVWADEHGFEPGRLPYSDGEYYYEGYTDGVYDFMYTGLNIYNADGRGMLYCFDLHSLCSGPDEETGRYSEVGQYMSWAKIYDGTLYVNIRHDYYASEEPNGNYMVAISLDTGDVLWRSESLVAGSYNFQIVKDTIVCGYGFTSEPDYIYLLDRFTGQTMEKIPVNSAPYQIETEGDTLYVATYNTAYEFKISDK